MKTSLAPPVTPSPGLPKCPTGIPGLEDITEGGLPQGRPTLVCGDAGCGKTLFGLEFLIHGALDYGEPGVFVAFEETAEELAANVRSLGYELPDLMRRGLLHIDHVHVERSEIEVTGDFDLEGLFIRLEAAIDAIGAKRVVLDTVESLFSTFDSPLILRAELRRLFRWIKDKGVTAIITGERGGGGTVTRQGLEEYVSDCVIMLDHRLHDQVPTRRLRILKYRGSHHGTNEYPFLITEQGISVLPVTSLRLDHTVVSERISTGIPKLDLMLDGGLFRGSSILISGTAGACKSTLAAHLAEATCRRGERCLFFAFEESPAQICRNMGSAGIDLAFWLDQGLLRIVAERPTFFGLESHLLSMQRAVEMFQPRTVILDPMSDYSVVGTEEDARLMLTRLVDYLKSHQITAVFTYLAQAGSPLEGTSMKVSSLMDTWLQLRIIELNGERNRGLYVLKCRGTDHSNQIREFVVDAQGIHLLEPYLGPGGVLTGSSRLAQETRDQMETLARAQEIESVHIELDAKRQAMEAAVTSLRTAFEAEAAKLQRLLAQNRQAQASQAEAKVKLARSRKADRPELSNSETLEKTK